MIRIKFLLCLFCLALFFYVPAEVNAQAAAISVGHVSAAPGETISVPISIDANPGLVAMAVSVSYDASRLAVSAPQSVTRGAALGRLNFIGPDGSTYSRNPFRVVWFGTADDSTTGTIVHVEFTVRTDAPAGHAYVSASVSEGAASNHAGATVSVSAGYGGIEIIGADALPPAQTPPPAAAPTPPTAAPTPTAAAPTPPTAAPTPPAAAPTPTAAAPMAPVLPDVSPAPIPEAAFTPSPPTPTVEPPAMIPTPGNIQPASPRPGRPPTLQNHAAFRVPPADAAPINFEDVSAAAWYHDAITFVVARGIFIGVGGNRFAPQTTMTRAMFITALANLDGGDTTVFEISPFTDVDISAWYGTAAAWARMEGIIDQNILYGSAPDTFRPNDSITREEMAVIFANYLEIRDFPLTGLAVPRFYDIEQASPWAVDAIGAMRSYSIIHGVGDNRYNPRGQATRAEIAQIFANLVRAIVE